ncbi:glycosyltransferase family 4 protein [Novosphingobium profundi]|uniref:glycosyltransferase family 4 protein n=1 Tax=Novosphingobium profundi TaxID=1774954 RepID=UPI001BD93515|nr:glycosyltransferase family 4 protein [Novosphingobium profundi]MBT0668686.1 glycosyltransferase family 4 protein [Novosphingobium profundi]
MKIVHYLNHTCLGNGHVAVAVDLSCEQVRAGHDVTVISGWGDWDEVLLRNGVKVIQFGESKGPFRLATMTWRFLRAVRRIKPDVVNAHMVYAAISARLARLVGPRLRYGLVTTVHNSFDQQANLMRVGDRVIVVSEAVGEDMKARGIPAEKIRAVTNGTVGGVRRPAFVGPPLALQHPAVVTVCGLHSRKGVGHLIDGFVAARRQFPGAHLYIVGGGPERADFEERARASGSGAHIHFMGYRDDPRDVLASADLFVLASLRDPCPLVLFEAREMGNPIIATAVDGIPETLAHGRRGVLVPPGDGGAIGHEIVRLLGNEQLRNTLSQAAREDIAEITVRRMSEKSMAVYAETLRAAARRPTVPAGVGNRAEAAAFAQARTVKGSGGEIGDRHEKR